MSSKADIAEYVKTIEAALIEEFEYCRKDVVYFANNYCVIEDKDAPEVIVPFRGWNEQNRVLKEISENRLNLILKARQLGITWLSLYYCVHDLVFNPGHTVVALSKTQEDAMELVRRVSVILDGMGEILSVGGLKMRATATSVSLVYDGEGAALKHKDNFNPESTLISVFKAFPASPAAGRSFTGNIVMLDEWAFQEYAREIWTSAYPTINRPTGGKVIGLSTIKKGTLFEDLWRADNAFHKIFLSVFADPRRTLEWYKQTEIDLGIKIKEEYPRTPEEALASLGGVFFPEFDYSVHTCEPFNIPDSWAVYNAMDYGLDMFAHYKIAINHEGFVYVFHEIYESNVIISDACARIISAETIFDDAGTKIIGKWHPPKARLAPPDLWNRAPENGTSRALEFSKYGISLVKTNNDRAAGWMAVKELLKPVMLSDGSIRARLKIFRSCENLIRTLPQILRDEKNADDCAKSPHELTHAPDALRYFAIYWTSPNQIQSEKRVKYRPSILEDWYNGNEATRAIIEKKMGGKPLFE